MHTLAAAVAAFLFTTIAVPAAGAEIGPDVLARTVTEEVLAIVRADKDLQVGQPQKVAQLVESKVLPHFNFEHMTQLAMGRNWRQAGPEQQKVLVEEFKTLLVRTYTAAFTQYRNETVDYRPVRMAPTDTDVIVKSVVKRPAGPPVTIDYSMEKNAGAWKVYDVRVEGISLVENYRNTFNSEVQRGGVDGLIRTLKDKNRTLAAQAAQRS